MSIDPTPRETRSHQSGPQPDWYVMRAGTRFGPFPIETLREHWHRGLLLPEDQVWAPSHPSWLAAASVFGSQAALDTATSPVSTSEAEATTPPQATWRDWTRALLQWRQRAGLGAVYALLIVTLMGLSLVSCVQFADPGKPKVESFALDGDSENALMLTVQVARIDLVQEMVRLRVMPSVKGKLSGVSARQPSRDIELTLDAVGAPRTISFKRRRFMRPFALDVPLTDGRLVMFPMDQYEGAIHAEASAAATTGTEAERIPVVVELNPVGHAMQITPQLSRRSESGDSVLRLSLKRLLPVVVFIWFMAFVSAMLSLTVVLVVVSVLTGRRKPELAMLGWMTALLFALPAVRNSLPGAPPLGAVIDYGSFFWAEALVGVSLMILVGLWFTHREVDV